MFKHEHYNTFYSLIMVFSLSILTAGVVLYASGKIIAVVCLLPILVIFYVNASSFSKIIFPLMMVTFPITIQVLGKDAFSTGTVIIFLTFVWSFTKYNFSLTFAEDRKFYFIILLIIFIAFIGMVTKTPNTFWGPAIRHYLNLISSVTLFFLIIHGQKLDGMAENSKRYIEKIIISLLLITSLHIVISLLIFNFPWVENLLEIFLKRGQERLGGHILGGVYTRATSVFTGGEELGELLILLFPFALYMLFSSSKFRYILIVLLFLIGVIISGTRSAFLLILFQTIVFIYLLAPAKYNRRKIAVTITFCFIGLIMSPVFLKYGHVLFDRMQDTLVSVGQKEGIDTIANRYSVWPIAYKITTTTLSLFGHGPVQAHVIGFPAKNFHSLYLTLIFQFGIVGSTIFFMFFGTMIGRLILNIRKKLIDEKGPQYLLAISCLLSLLCFLVNEFKFEFNRSDSYQQFVWCIFAVYYLTGTLKEKIEETTDNN